MPEATLAELTGPLPAPLRYLFLSSGPVRLGPGSEQCCRCPRKSCSPSRWRSCGAGAIGSSLSVTRCCCWRRDWAPVSPHGPLGGDPHLPTTAPSSSRHLSPTLVFSYPKSFLCTHSPHTFPDFCTSPPPLGTPFSSSVAVPLIVERGCQSVQRPGPALGIPEVHSRCVCLSPCH